MKPKVFSTHVSDFLIFEKQLAKFLEEVEFVDILSFNQVAVLDRFITTIMYIDMTKQVNEEVKIEPKRESKPYPKRDPKKWQNKRIVPKQEVKTESNQEVKKEVADATLENKQETIPDVHYSLEQGKAEEAVITQVPVIIVEETKQETSQNAFGGEVKETPTGGVI